MDIRTAAEPTTNGYADHYTRAAAWVRYNSLSGKATDAKILKVMRQLSSADLDRMLAERGVVVQ